MTQVITRGNSFLEDDCNNSTIDFNYYGEEVLLLYIHSFDFFELVILPIIALVGLLANSCFLFVIWRIRTMRTNLNKYLSALAVVDISLFVFGLSDRYLKRFSPIIFDNHSKIFGLAGCPFNLSIELTYYSSLMMVTLISLERYYAVCKPLSHRTFVGGNRTRRQIIGAFALAMFFVLLLIPYRGISRWSCVTYPQNGKYDHFPRKVILCFTDNEYIITVSQVIQALPFYTALVASSFFYIRITHVLIQWEKKHPVKVSNDVSYENETFASASSTAMTYCASNDMVSSVPSISSMAAAEDFGSKSSLYSKSSTRSEMSITSQRMRKKSRANQRAVTKMLLQGGFVFFICNSPIQFYFTLSSILRLFEVYISVSGPIFTLFQVLLYANSAINPFIYGVTNASYRAAFKKALLPWLKKA
ncbi:5-hydroxytryptamine receptor 1B [Holothuria leucospilota]|uniref:5-hydroxytryptamine receptor 1B n=1 Tax=Holothuria leucospilota TaxID=206669 RepID=A0A9Q1C4J4_HOLLE|nr:5-hydroxytryptamine receptor 1B [Holothuria leucospilota]